MIDKYLNEESSNNKHFIRFFSIYENIYEPEFLNESFTYIYSDQWVVKKHQLKNNIIVGIFPIFLVFGMAPN